MDKPSLIFEAGLLREEIRKSRLSQRKISRRLGLCEKSFSQRMNGIQEWKLSEIQAMKEIMPDMNTAEIFHIGTNKKQPIEKGQAAEWRRFEIINTDNQQVFEQLVCEKQLSRDDLMLILGTVRLRDL